MIRPIYYVDIGNTRLKVWRCREGRVEAHWAEAHGGAPGQLLLRLPSDFQAPPLKVAGICVMGQDAERDFTRAAERCWGVRPIYARAGAEFKGLRSAYREAPERLGVDRWLGMIGGAEDCDGFCVVGCGTAVTIDVMRAGEHLGGYILPGLGLMESALLQGTGRVRFEDGPPRALALGTDTAMAVRNGALAAVSALVGHVSREHHVDRLLLTGGDAEVVAGALPVASQVQPDLLLKGMMRYFDDLPDVSDEMTPEQPGGK